MFIKNYAKLARPLIDLTKTTQPFWEGKHTRACEALKRPMGSYRVLLQPADEKPFVLETDASLVGLGAILSQADNEGCLRLTAYASRKLSPAETRYSIRELGALTIVLGIEKFGYNLKSKNLRSLRTIPPMVDETGLT